MATQADGTAEREASVLMLSEFPDNGGRITWGGDKAYDTVEHVALLRELAATPHVAQNDANRQSAIDGRTTRHAGYEISLSRRWLVEKVFGWLKQTAGMRQVKLRGLEKVQWLFVFSCAAYTYCASRNCASSPCKSTGGHAIASTMVDCRTSAAISLPFSWHSRYCRRKNRSFSGFFNEFLIPYPLDA